MVSNNRFIDEKLSVSITSLVAPSNPVDSNKPLSFQEWLKYNNSLFTNADDFLSRYQSYLNNWYEIKNIAKPEQVAITKSLYTLLINEIVLSFTSTDERRFLKNIDFNNNRDLAVAVPFFAKKIKDICLYYSTLRDDVKSSVVQYNLKGSIYGTKNLIYNQISKSLETEDLTDLIRTLNYSLSDIRNNMVVDIEELYDTNQNYFDVSPYLPASSYDVTEGEREKYFSVNQYDIDPNLFLNFDTSIVDAITSYPFFLLEFGTNNFSANIPGLSSESLNYLKDRDYINTVNTEDRDNLNLNLNLNQITKFIGTDFYYISTNSTGVEYLSGRLFVADNNFANYLNKRYPSVAAIPSSEFIKSGKDIGLFFKPDKLGLSNFYSFGLATTIKNSVLSADTVYVFPDPSIYGDISSLTEEEFNSPIVYTDLSYFNKIDFSNQFKFGDTISGPYFQTLRAYQAREQSLGIGLQGLSRYTDSQDFFEGYKKNVWSNKDVFPIIPQNVFPIDNRIEKLYSINKTITQQKSDIYGNDYVLYKDVEPLKRLSNTPTNQGGLKIYYCLYIDGHVFFDAISGYNFDYTEYLPAKNYTGILLKTTTNIPPGTGYYVQGPNYLTPSPLSASKYNNGIPEFTLPSLTAVIVSYRFQPDTFCPDEIKVKFDCSVYDGETFVSPASGLLPDTSSDEPTFDPEIANVYYGILVDGGVNPNGPDYRANFVYPGEFTFTPPVSAVEDVNGSIFAYNSASPCGDDNVFSVSYIEKSNFMDYKIPFRNTQVIEGLSGIDSKRTLYETNFIDYGQLYYRNSNSSIVGPASAALSGMYLKYSVNIVNELNNNLINFDIVYDTIIFETENYLIADKLVFDYEQNKNIDISKNDCYFQRNANKELEKISTIWYNEEIDTFFFCKTVLYNQLSATNYKIVYPEIYAINASNLTFNKIYPQVSNSELTIDYLKMFSLSGNNIEVNIIKIDKPLFNYNNETGLYTITWLGKDIANSFYIFKTFFKYINGVITNISNSMFKLLPNVNTINFTGALSSYYATQNIAGEVGEVTNGEFIFN